MNKTETIISLLRADMADEHAAIVQYLQHAYALGESGEACEIEGIAREEMRHFDWLAEAIVELGGDPNLERGFVDLEGVTPAEWMVHDVAAEERAIAQYRDHISRIDDPKIKRLLERILADEESHKGDFEGMVEELAAEQSGEQIILTERKASGIPPHVVDILQSGIKHEYTVVLQYLYHDFVMPECEISREIEMQAINEMQHLGWLSEELAGAGGHPAFQAGELALEGSSEDMLAADIQAESDVTDTYTGQLAQIEEEGLRTLLERVRDQEIYHKEVFEDLAAELREDQKTQEAPTTEAKSSPAETHKFTIGSLIDED